jgi:hypothetical protein
VPSVPWAKIRPEHKYHNIPKTKPSRVLDMGNKREMGYEIEGVGDECPPYKYTARASEMTNRNGGWSRAGMLNYNALYLKVKENQVKNKGVFEKDYKEHWKEIYSPRNKRKRSSGGRFQVLTISDDLGELLTAVNSSSDTVVPVKICEYHLKFKNSKSCLGIEIIDVDSSVDTLAFNSTQLNWKSKHRIEFR